MELILIVLFYIILGFPFLLYFKEVVKPQNPYLGLVYSGIYGFIYFNLAQLILGFFGFPIVGFNACFIKILIAILPIVISLFYYRSFSFISNYFKSNEESKLNLIDYMLMLTIVFIVALLYIIINQNYYLGYDEFRIWLVNAKEIYTTGYLRVDLTAMDDHRYYSSFLSIPVVNLYEINGGVFESKGRYITILHAIFYFGVLLDITKNLQRIERIFLVLTSFITVLSFNNIFIKLLFINYIEVQMAFYIFFAVLVLFTDVKSIDTFIKKIFLFTILIYIISFSKQGTYYFAIPIISAFLVYEYVNRKNTALASVNIKKIIINKNLIFFILVFFGVGVGHLKYDLILKGADYNIENTHIPNSAKNVKSFSDVKSSFIQKVKYPIESIRAGFGNISIDRFVFLAKAAFKTYPGIFILLLVMVIASRFKIKNSLLLFVVISLMALVFMGYLTFGKPIGNHSFHRYMTHSFFCIPLFYYFSREHISNVSWPINYFSIGILILYLSFMVNKNIFSEINIGQSFHNGQLQYSDNFNKYTSAMLFKYKLSQIVGDQKVIFIDGNFSNGQNEELYIQYLMQENSVAGELKGVKNYSNTNLINKIDHDFVVIFDFNKSKFRLFNIENEIDDSLKVALFQKLNDGHYKYLNIN